MYVYCNPYILRHLPFKYFIFYYVYVLFMYFVSFSLTSSLRASLSLVLNLHDLLPFSVSRYWCNYISHLDSLKLTKIRARNRVVINSDWHNVLLYIDVNEFGKHWLH